MGSAVKLSDATIAALRDAAQVHSRSMSGQAEYWIKLGRAVERDPSFSYSRLDRALRGIEAVDPGSLTEQEQDYLFLNMARAAPPPQEETFWRDRHERGIGVGLDEEGNLVFEAQAVKPPTP